MEENIIELPGHTIIMNGGNPLPGCPESWDEAYAIIKQLNEGKEDWHPKWRFDCGFKLDFDGPILSVSSRFYPPKSHYGSTWDGSVRVFVLDEEILTQKFDCATLKELVESVEKYTSDLMKNISNTLKDNLK